MFKVDIRTKDDKNRSQGRFRDEPYVSLHIDHKLFIKKCFYCLRGKYIHAYRINKHIFVYTL